MVGDAFTLTHLRPRVNFLNVPENPPILRMKHMAGGNLQTSMSGSCAVCVDGVLYLFGGHHARGNANKVQSQWRYSCSTSEDAVFLASDGVFALRSADLPTPPQSRHLCLGRDEGSEGASTFLQGQAGLLGLQEQVRRCFFVWLQSCSFHKLQCQMSDSDFSPLFESPYCSC